MLKLLVSPFKMPIMEATKPRGFSWLDRASEGQEDFSSTDAEKGAAGPAAPSLPQTPLRSSLRAAASEPATGQREAFPAREKKPADQGGRRRILAGTASSGKRGRLSASISRLFRPPLQRRPGVRGRPGLEAAAARGRTEGGRGGVTGTSRPRIQECSRSAKGAGARQGVFRRRGGKSGRKAAGFGGTREEGASRAVVLHGKTAPARQETPTQPREGAKLPHRRPPKQTRAREETVQPERPERC